MEPLVVPVLLLVGGLLAVQSAANVQLSAAMVSPFGASTLQLGIGAALLVALSVLALYITAGVLLFPRLGALVTVGLFIAGQMLASLVLDGFGWLGVAQQTPDAAELAGNRCAVTREGEAGTHSRPRSGTLGRGCESERRDRPVPSPAADVEQAAVPVGRQGNAKPQGLVQRSVDDARRARRQG